MQQQHAENKELAASARHTRHIALDKLQTRSPLFMGGEAWRYARIKKHQRAGARRVNQFLLIKMKLMEVLDNLSDTASIAAISKAITQPGETPQTVQANRTFHRKVSMLTSHGFTYKQS